MPIIGINLLEEIHEKQGKEGFYFAGDYTGLPCMDIAAYSGKKVALSLIKNT